MSTTVADFLVERLVAWGTHRIFGLPGDSINAILGAVHRAEAHVEFVQARHEELAALMACAHAKFTDEVGVCLATSGPGAIHLLNGLYDAALDNQPVVALVGQVARMSIGSGYQQEVDLVSLFKDVAHRYVTLITDPTQVRHAVDQAFRIARAERCVTCLVIPKDVQDLEAVPHPPRTHGTTFSGIGYRAPRSVPEPDDLQRAADVLNAGQRVAMLVGAGALGAPDEVHEVAEVLGAGVAKALLGKAVLPDDLPWVTGAIGLIGTRPSWELMQQCDTLLMVGSNFPYAECLPEEGRARGVQIDVAGRHLGLRYPMEVLLQGDAGATLRALIPLLKPKGEREWRAQVERNVAEWWREMERRAHEPADPLNPELVCWELSKRLPDGAIITGDSGTSAAWIARIIRMRRGMSMSLSGGLATMGSAVPYAVAAKLAHPDRPVVAIAGDGAMQMNGLNALITASKFRERWSDPRFIVLVLDNRDLSFVSWEQRMMEGEPRFPTSQELPDFPYGRYGELIGFEGLVVTRPEGLPRALDRAFSATGPVLLEARVDPAVPILPPHVTEEQVRHFREALAHGDPDAAAVLRQIHREDEAVAQRIE